MQEHDTSSPQPNGPFYIRKWFYLVFGFTFLLWMGALAYDAFSPETEPEPGTETASGMPDIEEPLPSIQHNVFLLGEDTGLLADYEHVEQFQRASISEALEISEPSIFLAEYDQLDPRFDRVYQDLLANKHAVLFIGKQVDAEKVVPFFSESGIPVVPLSGTLPTFFQAYGAMYSEQAENEIPVFFGTNDTDSFNLDGFIRTLASLDEHFPR